MPLAAHTKARKAYKRQAATLTALTVNIAGTADSTIAVIPDPADTPASADALRDDLVANTLPAVREDIRDIAAKVNDLIDKLKTAGLVL